MLNKNGTVQHELVQKITPTKERIKKGPIAVAECFQSIPCNPCYTSCKRGAMKPLTDINDLPEINPDVCNGCGVCVSHCPGLAIFVIDGGYSDEVGTVKLPYEFLPLPQPGDTVDALDRGGNRLCDGKILKVINAPAQDKTAVVWMEVPIGYLMSARFFRTKATAVQEELERLLADKNEADKLRELDLAARGAEEGQKTEKPFLDDEDKTVVCRCENVTLRQIRDCITGGHHTVDEIKRLTRAGMGPCSGRTCSLIIQKEIEKLTGKKTGDQPLPSFRAPSTPIRMELLAKKDGEKL